MCKHNLLPKGMHRIFATMMAITLLFSSMAFAASAASEKISVPGDVFEFDKDSHYEFSSNSDSVGSKADNTYGTFAIGGNITSESTKNGIPAYEVTDGSLSLYYNHGDSLLTAGEDDWHLIDDKSKKLDYLTLDSNILKGAIVVQTSPDGLNWIDVISLTNAFSETPNRTGAIYETTEVQLINGCYYRVIVAYELRIRTEDSNVLFVNTDKYDYKKCAEVYKFYAYTDTGAVDNTVSKETHNLGSKVRVKDFDSYSGEEAITKEDIHYGWDLGNFFVSGYTEKVKDSNGEMVFLKNVGDKVTLWFRLNQNIDQLNGSPTLSITADKTGSDQYFETPTMNFGRGTLIIRYTDHNNVKAEPTIYTNYLEANTSVGADTKVQLFEEGDYEVALDYEVTNDQLIDKIGHYRIFFKFSIRNGNCMVYPFDIATGSELSNSSMTENGFRLDLAKSRYLKINLKREILTDSADGLVEDTRSNGPARDGAEYTDEGIYTITVTNEYTGQFTVKKIYVGTNSILRAHMATGLSITEINDLVEQGATISDDGTIQLANIVHPTITPSETTPDNEDPSENPAPQPNNDTQNLLPIIAAGGLAVVILLVIVIVSIKKKATRNAN